MTDTLTRRSLFSKLGVAVAAVAVGAAIPPPTAAEPEFEIITDELCGDAQLREQRASGQRVGHESRPFRSSASTSGCMVAAMFVHIITIGNGISRWSMKCSATAVRSPFQPISPR